LHNQQTSGGTWRIHGITLDKVMKRMEPIKAGAPRLWPLVQQILDECVKSGYLKPVARNWYGKLDQVRLINHSVCRFKDRRFDAQKCFF
jgi:hypothetical protein